MEPESEIKQLSRELEQLRDWVSSLDSLLALSSIASMRSTPAALLRQLIGMMVDMLHASGAVAGLYDNEQLCAEGYSQASEWHALPRTWAMHEGLPGSAVGHGWHHVSNDYRTDPLADAEWKSRFGVTRAICVPIIGQASQPLGFFELHRGADSAPFNHREVGFLESLANITAVALANHALLADLERKQCEIEALAAQQVATLEQERNALARELLELRSPVSVREREMLEGIAQGHTTATVAKLLGISVHTAVRHRANLMQKLGAHNTAELLQVARKRKLIL